MLLGLIVEPLLFWYDRHARILPWREEPTPYRVWISEIMLQQTRVEAVKPYFERFIKQLPDIESLSKVDDDKLMKLWEGLGYYNRARNLKKAAQIAVEQFGGRLPCSYDELLKLPGFGPYTAGAVGSIAFGLPVPAVDGNILRVITRVIADYSNISEIKGKRQIEEQVRKVIPAKRAGDFNQSLMELGATVCVPNGDPKCEICPLNELCEANRQGNQLDFPQKNEKKKRKIEEKTVLLLSCNGRTAIRKRPDKGLLAGLFEYPMIEDTYSKAQIVSFIEEKGFQIGEIYEAGRTKHIFTHKEWHMTGYRCAVTCQSKEFIWASVEDLQERYSIPSAFRYYTNQIIKNIRQ